MPKNETHNNTTTTTQVSTDSTHSAAALPELTLRHQDGAEPTVELPQHFANETQSLECSVTAGHKSK